MPTVDLSSMLADRLGKAVEVAENVPFETFSERRLWIRDKVGAIIPFKLKPIQRRYLAMKQKAINEGRPRKFLLLKYRRGGFTTLEQGLQYKLCVSQRHAWVATLAHTKDSTEKISMIAKLFAEEDRSRRGKKLDETVSLKFEDTKSRYFIGTAGGTAFGRGDTLQRVHCSEVAWWCPGPKQYSEVDRLMAGITEATSGGEVTLETTPNGLEWFANCFREAMSGLNDWTALFLPWFYDDENVAHEASYAAEEILETLSEEEKSLIEREKLSIGQIAWRRAKTKALGKLFRQEYPEDPDTCFLTSGQPFFDLDVVRSLLEWLPLVLEKLPVKVVRIPGGLAVYCEPPIPGQAYVAGCDTIEGLASSDENGVGIMDKETGRQIAWVYGRFRPEALAKHCYDLCHLYNEAFLGVERNNHGHSVINTLVNNLRYTNLFYFKNERGEPGQASLAGSAGIPATNLVLSCWTTSNSGSGIRRTCTSGGTVSSCSSVAVSSCKRTASTPRIQAPTTTRSPCGVSPTRFASTPDIGPRSSSLDRPPVPSESRKFEDRKGRKEPSPSRLRHDVVKCGTGEGPRPSGKPKEQGSKEKQQ